MFYDESSYGGNIQQANKLKANLTAEIRKFNQKYQPQIQLVNRSDYIVGSNHIRMIRKEEQDRRFCWRHVNSKYAGVETTQSKAYFKIEM